jgi:hypothetical protein
MAVAISRSGLLNSGRDFVFVFHICHYINPRETKKNWAASAAKGLMIRTVSGSGP